MPAECYGYVTVLYFFRFFLPDASNTRTWKSGAFLHRIRYNPFQKCRSLFHTEYIALGCVPKCLLSRLGSIANFRKRYLV